MHLGLGIGLRLGLGTGLGVCGYFGFWSVLLCTSSVHNITVMCKEVVTPDLHVSQHVMRNMHNDSFAIMMWSVTILQVSQIIFYLIMT